MKALYDEDMFIQFPENNIAHILAKEIALRIEIEFKEEVGYNISRGYNDDVKIRLHMGPKPGRPPIHFEQSFTTVAIDALQDDKELKGFMIENVVSSIKKASVGAAMNRVIEVNTILQDGAKT